MDPEATATRIVKAYESGDVEALESAINDLAEWVNRGGFLPKALAAFGGAYDTTARWTAAEATAWKALRSDASDLDESDGFIVFNRDGTIADSSIRPWKDGEPMEWFDDLANEVLATSVAGFAPAAEHGFRYDRRSPFAAAQARRLVKALID